MSWITEINSITSLCFESGGQIEMYAEPNLVNLANPSNLQTNENPAIRRD
jgi:hypothetical protein